MVSSPFAAQTTQPFNDAASCRSRLSDYGYDTFSDDDEYDNGNEVGAAAELGDCLAGGCGTGAAGGGRGGCKKRDAPFEDCGFWAEVGASGGDASNPYSPYFILP